VKVFLIHGMGRSRFSLRGLARRLSSVRHEPSRFGYSVTRSGFEEIAEAWVRHVEQRVTAGEPYAIVSHSLGGILTRHVLPRLPGGLCRFVMLAPPNRQATMAIQLEQNSLYRLLTGEAGQRLADGRFYASLPNPSGSVPTLVVAGSRGRSDRCSPFSGGANDGIVSVEETRLAGAQHLVVSAIHTLIMNHPQTTRAICDFLADDYVPTAEQTS
jgi:pimeloyl-ACP methyl ester carboxylesterase